MSVSFLASVRAMFGPSPAFDRPQRAGTPPRPDAHAPGAALGARAIDVAAGDFRLSARHVRFRLGAITAIVGPNGSGKTTLLETLLGFRRGGSDVRVLDVPAERFMRDSRSLQRLGAQLQKVEYPDHLRVSEIVALHRAMYAHTDAAIADALGIAELLDKPCRALSKGQRQRVDLYVALAHRPELAVLDEPFTGLDRRYAGVVIDLLRHRASGTSVAMICHSEEELSVVDDLVWVRDGGVRYQGDRDTLRAELVGDARAVLHCRDEADRARAAQAARGAARRDRRARVGRARGRGVRRRDAASERAPDRRRTRHPASGARAEHAGRPAAPVHRGPDP
nr:ATP-binding cassette domain-containing protein [Burkholderia cenocepacia]